MQKTLNELESMHWQKILNFNK
ncbi:hypothetical protein RGZ1_27 [Morganella phage vB_MmoM_Rgz1]|nr:hypothetical protein RGZ1_27 [Morganella phage vB_MmoM_Rgz1]